MIDFRKLDMRKRKIQKRNNQDLEELINELDDKIRRERDAIDYCLKRAQDWTAQVEAHRIELARLDASADLLSMAEAEREKKKGGR